MEQNAIWNGTPGQAWVDAQDLLDAMFKPLEDLLVDAIPRHAGQRVLDVGCGTGTTTLAVARRLADTAGHGLGIDISAPMIAAARARAQADGSSATFVLDDAQGHAFEPAGFDHIMSRFGVMFFNDAVAAFTNLRRAARDHATMTFLAWRSAEENPFMTTAERAAAPLLPEIPARQPDEPGQFAFARASRMHHILETSGWADIHAEPLDVLCTFPESGLVRYLTQLGPLGRLLPTVEGRRRDQVIDQVRTAFEPYVQGDTVRFTAACWKVSSRAPARFAATPA